MTNIQSHSPASEYFKHWTSGNFNAAAALLAENLTIETPINSYSNKHDFVEALSSFGAIVEAVVPIAELFDGVDAVQIYDLQVASLGRLRVAEHFVVKNGKIVALRQIHDTVALRLAGFVRDSD